jgi:hypothetical protein
MRRRGQASQADGSVGTVETEKACRLYEMPALVHARVSDRKRRLFAAACLRRVASRLLDARSRLALEVAERYADGLASEEARRDAEEAAAAAHYELRRARFTEDPSLAWSWAGEQLTRAAVLVASHGLFYAEDAADYARRSLAGVGDEDAEERAQCALLREITGPLPGALPAVDPLWLLANDRAALRLAGESFERGAFDLLPVVADALEDAGCDAVEILAHLRGPGPHVRGCWCVDLLLGKE